MTGAIQLRRAGEADVPLLHAMLQELAAAIGQPEAMRSQPQDLLHHGFGKDARFFAVIAAIAGKDAGMLIGFAEYSSWRGKPGIYVQDLYVRDSFRSRGVARALLAEAAGEAARIGGSYLRLSIAADNHGAAQFYGRAGFTEAADERIFTCDGPALAGMLRPD